MKAILAVGTLALALALAGGQVQAGGYHGHYSHGGYSPGHSGAYYGYRSSYPRSYGGYYGSYHHHNRYDGGDLAGALVIGAVLGHVLTQPSYSYSYSYREPAYRVAAPVYRSSSYYGDDYYRARPAVSYQTYEPGLYSRRYVLDADGTCNLVNTEADGHEVWTRVPDSNCR